MSQQVAALRPTAIQGFTFTPGKCFPGGGIRTDDPPQISPRDYFQLLIVVRLCRPPPELSVSMATAAQWCSDEDEQEATHLS